MFVLIEEEKGRLFLNRAKSLTSPRLELSTDQNEREKQGSARKQYSMVCALINDKNDVKMFKTKGTTPALGDVRAALINLTA